MQDKISEFVLKRKSELIFLIKEYLSEKIDHDQIRNYAFDVIDYWPAMKREIAKKSCVSEEKTFWAAIWVIQALADKEHWEDGLPQEQLREILNALENRTMLPKEYHWG